MNLLITGACGLLGLNLALEARREHTVVGVDRGALGPVPFTLLRRDLMEGDAIEQTLRESRAEAVIHCAAIADVDLCERDREAAWRLNARLPERIATACARAGLGLVHISTDAVFDGTKEEPYVETDEPHPIGVYAETKWAAERAVIAAHPNAIVARVNFYGWSVSGTRSLAEFFVNNLGAGRRVRGFVDVVFCPLLVNQLAVLLLTMLHRGMRGLYHAVGNEPMSKFAFGTAIARQFGFDEKLIERHSVDEAGLSARRSHNMQLSVHKLSTALGEAFPRFSTGLATFHQQYLEGYPQQLKGYQQGSVAGGALDAASRRLEETTSE